MAKKSFKSKRKTNDLIMVVGGAIAGGVIANVAKKTVMANFTQTIQNAVILGAGIAAPMLIDNKIVDAAGAGMIAVGGAGLAAQYIPGLAGFDHAIGATPRETVYRTIADSTRVVEEGEKKNLTETLL